MLLRDDEQNNIKAGSVCKNEDDVKGIYITYRGTANRVWYGISLTGKSWIAKTKPRLLAKNLDRYLARETSKELEYLHCH